MRYYSLRLSVPPVGPGGIANAAAALTYIPTAAGFAVGPSLYTFSSHPLGPGLPPDPGALDIEFDLPVVPGHTPQGGSLITVHGVGLTMLSQATQLSGAAFVLSGGMGVGLPLATVDYLTGQSGILASGIVRQAFGNWEGTDQSLGLICYPGNLAPSGGINFQWLTGQPLDAALLLCLTQAWGLTYPLPQISVTPGFVPPQGEPVTHFAESFWDFATWLQQFTQDAGSQLPVVGSNYPGVWLSIRNGTIYATDFQVPAPNSVPIPLQFQDLIGQPTWIDPNTIQFSTVMRADLSIGSRVLMPVTINAPYAITSAAAAVPGAPSRSLSAFQGIFMVSEVHHFAHFRQADAGSWATAITAIATLAGGPPLSTSLSSGIPGL